MTKADKLLVQDIHNILENGYKDVNPRPRYEDGTPAYTISVNHVMRKYDLSKGEFPICTLRRQAWKTGVREIFTIYQHPTNVLSEMRDLGVTWWDPWDIGDGTIGQRYGATVKRYDLIHKLIEDIQKDPSAGDQGTRALRIPDHVECAREVSGHEHDPAQRRYADRFRRRRHQ